MNNFYIYIANASNAIWYDQALRALYSGQILAFYYQPNLWNSKSNFVGVKPPPQDSNRVNGLLSGLGVWFLLWVQEVPGSNPGWALNSWTTIGYHELLKLIYI